MNVAVVTTAPGQRSLADSALKTAAQFWFVVAVAGQWIFAYYIAARYGGSALQGNWQAWDHLSNGYVAGNTLGNTAMVGHILLAAVIHFGGPLQLIPQIRARFPVFHRWSGRIYLPVAFIMGITGLYLTLSGRKVVGDTPQHVAISINAVLIIIFAALAWRYALARDFGAHRRWVLRLFLVVSGVWFLRIGLMFWLAVNHGPVGFDPKTFSGPFLTFLSFAQFLLPLAILELYLRAREGGSISAKFVATVVLVASAAVTGTGVFAATMGMWLPHL
jgi:hypothetical protein